MASTPYDDVAKRLWDETGTDWHVFVRHTLTEPTCALIDLEADDEALPKLVGFIGGYDVNESIRLACEHHLRSLANDGKLKR